MSRTAELRAGVDYVNAELARLDAEADNRDLTAEEWQAVTDGMTFVTDTEAKIKSLDALAAAAAAGRGSPGDDRPSFNLNKDPDPYDLTTQPIMLGVTTREQLRARAATAIEKTVALPAANGAAATALIEQIDTPSGALARHILATGSDAYRAGWQKRMGGRGDLMSDAERHALEISNSLSLTDDQGGFAVPFTLDPTIISTKDMATNPFRRIAAIKTVVTDTWNGVTSAGMTVSWDGEAAEVSDDSPTIAQPSIRVHKAQGFALGSIEITQDWRSIETDLRSMIQDSKDDAEAVVFTTGAGDVSNQPTGIVTALAGTGSEVSPATAETFAAADVYAVQEALPPRYRLAMMNGDVQESRAVWLATRGTYNQTRQFDTQGGAQLWASLGQGLPQVLLGHRDYEASSMQSASDINAAVTANNRVLLLGDFRFYCIVDRVGLTVEFIPHVFGSNGRPTGRRGWYCYWRVGADSVNDDAFRLLNVPTTA